MKFRDNFKSKFKNYYQNQRVWPRYLFLGLMFSLFLVFFLGNNPKQQVETLDYEKLHFVGNYIPLDWKYFYNQEKIDREIAITKLNTAQFVMYHKREKVVLDYIRKELLANDVPTDFWYLAVAESALRVDAYSSAGAAWVWQFMPGTAKKYGLIVNNEIDERYNLEKSTDAAIKYIVDLYYKFQDRNLVAAAYNRWENGLQRDMQSQQQSGYYDLRLNTETSRYVFRIIAIKYLMENRYKYFDVNVLGEQYESPKTKTIKLGETINLTDRAVSKWYSYAEIRQLNPRIRWNYLPEWKRKIKVFK